MPGTDRSPIAPLVNPNHKNWAPRLGAAYSIIPKPLIRAGYGLSYVLFIRQGGDSYLAYNGPFVVNAQITQSASQVNLPAQSEPLTCFRPTQQGYPDGFTAGSNFSPVKHQDRVRSEGYPLALRAETGTSTSSANWLSLFSSDVGYCRQSQRWTVGSTKI